MITTFEGRLKGANKSSADVIFKFHCDKHISATVFDSLKFYF